MIDLHERLSEFSYGYGVTREVEQLLASVGIHTAPFLPSLLHEGELAFDVAFNKPGAVILLQFKLGQSLKRFVRTDPNTSAPVLDRPFWRFSLNTAEPNGQFETLLKAELDGAEAYYAAPRFVDWAEYLAAYEKQEVLVRSVLVRPTDVRRALLRRGLADGPHRVVYDNARDYVCSEPEPLERVDPETLAKTVQDRIKIESDGLAVAVQRVFTGLDDRHLVRRSIPEPSDRKSVV